ncbi:MAG: glutamine--fructose-6-phosphate transaminase (isomerizing) [Clostridia bacterium]|nr:glutamine--fructose-6-phosphate transaminase (isomerizing) [Clostridia bacterium]
MCGIVGYTGYRQCTPILLEGLKSLEYRGYDSSGIAVLENDSLHVEKAEGRLAVLADRLQEGVLLPGKTGIGHTRWATHGKPSDENAHPHVSENGKIAVVHNGIIENYRKLKEELIGKGYHFVSDTDTEIFAHLLDYYFRGNILEAIYKMMRKVNGAYALGILCDEMPGTVIAVKKDSPLVVGLGKDENFIASDVPAILKHTRTVFYPEDGEIVILRPDSVEVYGKDGERIEKEVEAVAWDASAAEKGGYPHFMMKEMMEQPRAMADTILPRLAGSVAQPEISGLSEAFLRNVDKIYIVACGSAYHVGVAAKYILEEMTGKNVEPDLASEFRYRVPILTEHSLVIIISQSGETADSIAAMREAKRRGAHVLSIVNVLGSTIAKESDDVLYTWAGPEIAVATTKAYSAQLCAVYVLALYIAEILGTINLEEAERFAAALRALPEKAEELLSEHSKIQYAASRLSSSHNIFFIGRNLEFAAAMEGSLKLKEISYIHSEAYAAGELKHGTISLIEEGTPVVALMTSGALTDKMRSNIREVKARGAFVLALADVDVEIGEEADVVLRIPKTHHLLRTSLAVLPLQLLAYYVALVRGCDIDKPRNLAKSVTVE